MLNRIRHVSHYRPVRDFVRHRQSELRYRLSLGDGKSHRDLGGTGQQVADGERLLRLAVPAVLSNRADLHQIRRSREGNEIIELRINGASTSITMIRKLCKCDIQEK